VLVRTFVNVCAIALFNVDSFVEKLRLTLQTPPKKNPGRVAWRANFSTDSELCVQTNELEMVSSASKDAPPLFADFEVFDDDIMRVTIFETNPFRYNG
jgi:hypothetical protein